MENFIKLVEEMRHHQKEYFRTRSNSAMAQAIIAEKKVDLALKNLTEGTPLFGGSDEA